MSKVLGYYEISKVILPLLICVSLCLFVVYITIWLDGGHVIKYVLLPNHRILIPLLIFSWFGAGLGILLSAIVLAELFLENRKALWIENGSLIFMHRWVFSTKCVDISDISIGDAGIAGHRSIVVSVRSGGQKVFPVGTLTEPVDKLVWRIKSALAELGNPQFR